MSDRNAGAGMLREMLERAGRLNRQFFYAGVARERIQVLVEDGRHP